MSEARTVVRATIRTIDAISRRTRSRRVNGSPGRSLDEHAVHDRSARPAQAGRDELADALAVGPAAGPGRRASPSPCPGRGASAAPVAVIASSTRAAKSASPSCSGRYAPRIAISASSLAARSSRPPLRKASTDSRRVLTSRATTARQLVVGERLAALLLEVVGRVLDHPQGVAAQHVTRPHRGGRLGLESFLEGHRLCWHLGRVARCGARSRPSSATCGRPSCAWLPCACA